MKIWSYITTLLTGVIAGLLIFLKLKDPDTVINDNQSIGKLKQRGDGALQNVDLQNTLEISGRQTRQILKARRIARRRERRGAGKPNPP